LRFGVGIASGHGWVSSIKQGVVCEFFCATAALDSRDPAITS
jgi:hypothetical protein